MRTRHIIQALFLSLFFAACARPVETRHGTSLPTDVSPELSAIDSLMWQRPDSALTCLLPYFDTCCRDGVHTVSTTHDCHYANLLLAELLYKNDNPQLNRAELLQAVDYYDSLYACTDVARNVSTNAFLDARAHYINGVGYYERDSVVEACQEYLKALEVMEERFDEKELAGNKARFMTYTYNRLGYMFERQYVMEPAIDCYKHSYYYSIISPISKYSVSIALYHIGKQCDMNGDKDSANYYYSQALDNMPDSKNPYFRDIASTQALLSYQLNHQAEASLNRLKQMAVMAEDDDEKLTRYLLIGGIYYEEKFYDSACHYLEPVWNNEKNRSLKIQVANYLRIIYDSLGNKEKSNNCMNYLALHNETGAENNVLVSQLSDLYKLHVSWKQEKKVRIIQEMTIKNTISIVIPMAVVLVLAIIVIAKLRNKQLLKNQREEANRKLNEKEQQHQQEMEERKRQHSEFLETERQIHRMEQAALSGRLKRSNEEVRMLKGRIKRQEELESSSKQAESFTDEPICRLILERVKNGQFLSQTDCNIYKDYALSKEQIVSLREVADLHFGFFALRLAKAYPKLTQSDLDYCCLYLLGLSDADVSALMQKAYPTISQRSRKIKAILGNDSPLPLTLRGIANNYL